MFLVKCIIGYFLVGLVVAFGFAFFIESEDMLSIIVTIWPIVVLGGAIRGIYYVSIKLIVWLANEIRRMAR